jgi:hypothetical protein
LLLAGALAGLGCDQGEPQVEPAQGPPVGLVATFPADGAGTECLPDDPAACGVRIDTAIELRFDRFLLPGSVNRQAFAIYTGEPRNAVGNQYFRDAPSVVYDVVERVVTITLDAGEFFQPHTLYTVELVLFGGEQEYGLRATDGAPMGAGRLPLSFSFYTNGLSPEEQAAVADPNPVLEEPEFTCVDVLGWLGEGDGQGKCSVCHDTEAPPMGLELHSGQALLDTAIGQVAHQTDLASVTGASFENAARFGVGMPRIDPEQPNNSYLLYKLLIKPDNYRRSPRDDEKCESVHRVDLAGECEPSAEEIARLRDRFVLGDPMPRGGSSTPGASLYRSYLRGIQSWIRAGATCD